MCNIKHKYNEFFTSNVGLDHIHLYYVCRVNKKSLYNMGADMTKNLNLKQVAPLWSLSLLENVL